MGLSSARAIQVPVLGSGHDMSYGLNSLKGGYIGDYSELVKGVTRSLDYSSDGSLHIFSCLGKNLEKLNPKP